MNINRYSKALSWITRPRSTETATLENFNPEEFRSGFQGAGLVESRIGFKRGTTLASQKSVDEYVNIIRNMIKDNKYVPTANIDRREMGPIPNFQKAKEIVKAETGESFDILYNRNIKKRKDIKRWQDPEKKEYDIMKKAERKQTKRLKEADIKPSPREAKINLDQRKITRKLNVPIKNNPELVLKNKALMDQLSFTVSKDGDIIKVKPNLDDIKNRGIVEVDHQRDIYKKGKMKNLPYNRNLILGPYNREGGFKKTAETFIKKNPDPNNVKVKNIIKKAKQLGITLQPDVPKGTFPTKSIGYVQKGGPVEKFVNAAKKVFKKAKPVLQTAQLKSEVIPGSSAVIENIPKHLKAAKSAYSTMGAVPWLFRYVLPPVGLTMGTYFSQKAYQEGKPVDEVLAEFFGAGHVPYKIKEFFSMTSEQKDAVRRIQMTEAGETAKRQRPYKTYGQEIGEAPSYIQEGDVELVKEGEETFKEEKYEPFLEKKKSERGPFLKGIKQLFTPQKFDPYA